jgi:hypothetical protein
MTEKRIYELRNSPVVKDGNRKDGRVKRQFGNIVLEYSAEIEPEVRLMRLGLRQGKKI